MSRLGYLYELFSSLYKSRPIRDEMGGLIEIGMVKLQTLMPQRGRGEDLFKKLTLRGGGY